MSKLILTVGIPGSGKSTWSQQYIRENLNTVRINADRLREMLFAYNPSRIREYWNHKDLQANETIVRFAVKQLAETLFMQNINVIVDALNLKKSIIEPYEQLAVKFDSRFYIKEFNTPLITCITRDQQRTRSAGKNYIEKSYMQFQKLKETDYYKNLNKL